MIRLINITTGYIKDKPLLTNCSMQFEDNKIYGILGESGIGKSTLLKTIAGLIKPIDGIVTVNDKKIVKPQKSGVYMMHQNYTSFDWLSCLDNILIAKRVLKSKITKEDRENALGLLTKVGLNGYEYKYPKQLSGGQRQRLALARTLFVRPLIILMDEPLSALDETTREKMQDLILDIHKETKNTILMITHSNSEAQKMCNDIVTLK